MGVEEKLNEITIPKCQYCGKPLKYVPAGISKRTGKEYGEFWACPDTKCGNTVNPHML